MKTKTISPFAWKLCAAILVAGLTACASLLVARRLQLSRVEERFLDETLALASDRFERPTHSAPALSGTFGERAAAHLETLVAAQAGLGEISAADLQLLASVLRGAQPSSAAPARLRAMLEKSRPALHGLLQATHAEAARPPPAMTAPTLEEPAVAAMKLASQLVALEMVVEVESGRAAEAAARCADGLALARDLGFGSALQGRMLATYVVATLVTPCARAIDAAPVHAKRQALRQLRTIREATPSFAATLAEERTSWIAASLGAAFDLELLQRLPPRFRAAARQSAGQTGIAAAGQIMRAAWPTLEEAWLELAAAQSLGREARQEARERVRERLAASKNPICAVAAPTLTLDRFELKDRVARTQLELLMHAAALDLHRAETGRWPELLSELEPQVGPNARADAVREASLLYFVSAAEAAVSVEGGLAELTHIAVNADLEVSP